MNYAVIDIGSNTVKCEIFSYNEKKLNSIDFFSRQLGIIARIKNGVLDKNDTKILCETITSFIDKASDYHCKIYCFATESLRKITNLEEIKSIVKEKCNIDIELISGEDEAMLSFEGFMAEEHCITEGIMVDMGGGSTEILSFSNSEAKLLNSFKFGCLSLKKEFVKSRFPNEKDKKRITAHVNEELNGYDWINNQPCLCLIGGTGSAIGKLALELGFTQVPEFPKETFMKLFTYLEKPGEKEIKLLEKYIPARVETIIPGMTAYRTIIERINAKTVYVSKGGIRNGYIYRIINEEK